jgi:hypothetical protein
MRHHRSVDLCSLSVNSEEGYWNTRYHPKWSLCVLTENAAKLREAITPINEGDEFSPRNTFRNWFRRSEIGFSDTTRYRSLLAWAW